MYPHIFDLDRLGVLLAFVVGAGRHRVPS
jgi:hypothetical protein